MMMVVVIRGRKGSIGCGHGADDVTSGGGDGHGGRHGNTDSGSGEVAVAMGSDAGDGSTERCRRLPAQAVCRSHFSSLPLRAPACSFPTHNVPSGANNWLSVDLAFH